MRFYGKPKKARKGLGDRMLEGAKKRSGTVRPRKRVWLGKVVAFAIAGAAMGEVLGAIAARMWGSPEITISIGCIVGALAGALLGGGNGVEALLGAVLGGVLAFADYYLIKWGGLPFQGVAQVSVLGPAGVFAGVIIGRLLTKEKKAGPESADGKS